MSRLALVLLAATAVLAGCEENRTVYRGGYPRYGVYDRDRDRVSGRDVERARDACRQIAESRDWRNVRTAVRDRDRNGRVVVEVSGRRRGEDRDRECRYDVRRGDAEFRDQG
jgi:hypothetical protein